VCQTKNGGDWGVTHFLAGPSWQQAPSRSVTPSSCCAATARRPPPTACMAQRPECCWPPPRSYSPDLGPSQRGAKPTRLVFTPWAHHLAIDAGPTPGGRPYAVRFECPASKVTTGPDRARSPSSAAGPPRHVHRHHGAELGATLLEDAWVDADKVLLVDSNPRQLLPPPRHYADRPSGRPGAYYRDRAGHPSDCRSVRDRERARRTSRVGTRRLRAALRAAPNGLICTPRDDGARPRRGANIRQAPPHHPQRRMATHRL